ncbi:leucine-rich repeat extensin-like protein 4 [Ipomoea triloba]|uniref:leucine-rich repeat extensin-like protein 4 n=1 Tax=Ipomoea triloba TaxID=35885 RepID=UPI00125D22A2|nr:leucine-rich repeat extensin-like protein 4 [Ipomoea triloba]
MAKSWLLFVLLLHAIAIEAAMSVSVSGGVGVGVGIGMGGGNGGGGGGGVWIGGGINSPGPTGSSGGSKLQKAYTALQALKSAISEDPLGILNSWVGSNVCDYKGVFCSDSQDFMGNPDEVVAGIDLNHANLKGVLVKELSLLTDLSLLHLNTNRFSGTIPETFRDLVSLTELDLSNNQFSGSFPITVLLIPNLLYLDIRFNSFSGPIPEQVFNKKLDAIFLNDNQFSGELPQSLGNSPASVINLANNNFSGSIPFSLGYMGPRIKEILFLNNQLTGCIPEGVGMWTDLEVLDVSSNSLMGHLPDSISCLSGIEVLNLANNKLSGELPDIVCSLKRLLNLTITYNFFSGLSQDCDRLPTRNVGFDFSLNCIPGRQMQRSQPECSAIPGSSLSCLRIPSPKPTVCGALIGGEGEKTSASPPPPH